MSSVKAAWLAVAAAAAGGRAGGTQTQQPLTTHALADFAAAEKTSELAAAAQTGAQHDARAPCTAKGSGRVAGALARLCRYSHVKAAKHMRRRHLRVHQRRRR